MTVVVTLAKLKGQLETITSPLSLKKVYSDPKEATSLGEFPCAVLALAPSPAQHGWREETMGGIGRHDYTVSCWLFLGARTTPLPELHSRTLPWPEAVARALFANLTLDGAVYFVGGGDEGNSLFTYSIGPIAWGDQELWGLTCQIPVTEKQIVTMGPN